MRIIKEATDAEGTKEKNLKAQQKTKEEKARSNTLKNKKSMREWRHQRMAECKGKSEMTEQPNSF